MEIIEKIIGTASSHCGVWAKNPELFLKFQSYDFQLWVAYKAFVVYAILSAALWLFWGVRLRRFAYCSIFSIATVALCYFCLTFFRGARDRTPFRWRLVEHELD